MNLRLHGQQIAKMQNMHGIGHRTDSGDTNQSKVNILDYFRSSANIKEDKEASRKIMQRIHNEFSDIFRQHRML